LVALLLFKPSVDSSPLPSLIGGIGIQTAIGNFLREADKIIREHKRTRDENSPPRDFIDYFLSELDKNAADEKSALGPKDGDMNLKSTLADFMIGGTDTTCKF